MKKILIRADGSRDLGMGHLFRVSNISKYILLYDNDVEITILTKNYNEAKRYFSTFFSNDFGIKIIYLPESIERFKEINYIPSRQYDVVIFDLLNTEEEYIKMYKYIAKKIISFDDIGSGLMYCDVVFNALVDTPPSILDKYKDTIIFSGPKYLPIRKEIMEKRKLTFDNCIKNVLITMGGSDPNGLTFKVLDALQNELNNYNVRVIIGPGFKYFSTLEEKYLSRFSKNVDFLYSVSNMEDHIHWANIAISSGGLTVYELAAIGTPSLVLCQNHHENTNIFYKYNFNRKIGLGTTISHKEILLQFKKFVSDKDALVYMFQNGHKYIDGKALARIKEVILGERIRR